MLGSDEDRVWRPRPRDLLGALGLLTAWPAERPQVQSQDFGRATPFFPLAGLLIGAVLAGLNWLMGPGLPAWAAGLVLVVAWEALAGGALPRAAWALGATASGREERWLAGLVLSTTLLAKIACLAPQTSSRSAALLFAPMLARWAMVVLAAGARDADAPGRKFNAAITFREFALASIFTCVVVFTLAEALGILLVACVAAAALAGRLLAHHRAGGVSWRMLLASAGAVEVLVLVLFVVLQVDPSPRVGYLARVDNVVAVILGGGRGTRLYPLTQLRSKPAVPLAGKYRLVDIPISNCINSGLRNIFVLSQFQSASLNRHVAQTYRFDPFSRGFVEILAAEQTEASMDWYQGTADAVRKQLHRFLRRNAESILVLSGDQLYVMDFRKILEAHTASRADITVAATPVTERDASEFGILQIDGFGTVVDFAEKPRELSTLARLALSEQTLAARGVTKERRYLASMGIYAFRPEVLVRVLEDPGQLDFGKEIIPRAIHSERVHSHFFSGYWEDIGTIRTFYGANIDLASANPPIDLFSQRAPIYTRPRFLPGTQLRGTRCADAIVCEGCRIEEAEIDNSIIGIRSIIGRGARLSQTVMMGADFYEAPQSYHAAAEAIPVGVGAGSTIERAIIDKNARIGEGVVVRNERQLERHDGRGFYIRDGIVIIPKNGVIPAGTVI